MAKLTLNDLTNLQNENSVVTKLNTNNTLIETALENTLSRDGTSPNTMEADLDMNSNAILNLPEAVDDTSPIRKIEFDEAIAGLSSGSGGGGTIDDPELNAIAGLTSAADSFPYFTGSGTASLAVIPTYGRSLASSASAAAARTTLGLVVGTDVQAQDTELSALAGTTSAADTVPYYTGSGTASTTSLTSFGRSLVDDASASVARATLGVALVYNVKVTPDASNATTGDNAINFAIDSSLNGMDLKSATAYCTTVSSSGTVDVNIRNKTNSNLDMLSTKITIDANEFTSYTAATPPVINLSNDNVATGDIISVDIDSVGTGSAGIGVILVFG